MNWFNKWITKRFINILKNDKEYRRVFKDNIAMATYDNFNWHRQKTGKYTSREDMHQISNKGAEYFLNLLTEVPKDDKIEFTPDLQVDKG